jgi:hypothetical protein
VGSRDNASAGAAVLVGVVRTCYFGDFFLKRSGATACVAEVDRVELVDTVIPAA